VALRRHLCVHATGVSSVTMSMARPLLLALVFLGCGPKDEGTAGTTSTDTGGTSASGTTGPGSPTTMLEEMCEDRSVYCMPLPDEDSTGGEASASPPGCEDLLPQLESAAQGLCTAGFVAVGLSEIEVFTDCCFVYRCEDPTSVCTPLGDRCESQDDLGQGSEAAANACSSFIGSDLAPVPQGEFCCAEYQCYCGPTGG